MTTQIRKRRPILLSLVVFQALSGLAGGFGLVSDPSGNSIQLPIDLLEGTPFGDYLVPGIILGLVLGVYPLVVAVAMWLGKRWSVWGALVLGVALVIWILVEIVMIGYIAWPPLQLIYGLLGLVISVIAALAIARQARA